MRAQDVMMQLDVSIHPKKSRSSRRMVKVQLYVFILFNH